MRLRRKDPWPSPGFPTVSSVSTGSSQSRHDAFHTFVEPEIDVMLRVARTLTGSWTDAEDLVQDALIRAYRSIDRFDGAHPRAWLLTIVRNTNINAHRRQRPGLVDADMDLETARPAFGAALTPSPEDTVTEHVFGDEVGHALACLVEKFRIVVLLIDVDQLTYAEVAELLDIPLGTVMSRLSRARDRMRVELRPTITHLSRTHTRTRARRPR